MTVDASVSLTEWGDRYIVTYRGPDTFWPTGGKLIAGTRLGTIALAMGRAESTPVWRLYNDRHEMVGYTPTPASPEDAANHLRIIVTGADR